VQTTLRASSYTNHYREGLIELLSVLDFRSNNTGHRPVIDALALVARYAKAGNTTYYPLGEGMPGHRGTAAPRHRGASGRGLLTTASPNSNGASTSSWPD
jgi:hypothetical protein